MCSKKRGRARLAGLALIQSCSSASQMVWRAWFKTGGLWVTPKVMWTALKRQRLFVPLQHNLGSCRPAGRPVDDGDFLA